mmetsp:Transcript_39052/g.47000  ORF Transcript_39052/g.47000 Transcript_39052/m.47000 type:complete len:593 (+) Transcript_39052:38-1816(+)
MTHVERNVSEKVKKMPKKDNRYIFVINHRFYVLVVFIIHISQCFLSGSNRSSTPSCFTNAFLPSNFQRQKTEVFTGGQCSKLPSVTTSITSRTQKQNIWHNLSTKNMNHMPLTSRKTTSASILYMAGGGGKNNFERNVLSQRKSSRSSDPPFDAEGKFAVQATSMVETSAMEEVEKLLPIELESAIRNDCQAGNSTVIVNISDEQQQNPGFLFAGIPIGSALLLNFVAVVWGSQHAVIKSVLTQSGADGGSLDTAAFTLSRFIIGALVASPYTPAIKPVINKLFSKIMVDNSITYNSSENSDQISTTGEEIPSSSSVLAWRWGAELGFWMFLGYAFQAVGLEFTTASRSGFLLYLNVKFVPFLSRILFGKTISINTWVSAGTAFVGTFLLSCGDLTNGATPTGLNVGDLWSLAAAVASAMFILRMEKASVEVQESSELNAASLWVVTALSLFWSVGSVVLKGNGEMVQSATSDIVGSVPYTDISISFGSNPLIVTFGNVFDTIAAHPLELIYLGAITTALTNYLQAKGQKNISAERASVIYAMDPVYGAFFANFLLGETLGGVTGYFGAFLIAVAAATNAFLDPNSKAKEKL